MSEQSWGQDLISKRAQNSGVCSAPLITMTGLWVIVVLKVWRISVRRKCTVEGKVHLIHAFFFVVFALQRQGSGAAAGNNKTSGEQGKQKNNKTYIISKTPNFTNVTFQQPPKRSILKSDVCSTFKIIAKFVEMPFKKSPYFENPIACLCHLVCQSTPLSLTFKQCWHQDNNSKQPWKTDEDILGLP